MCILSDMETVNLKDVVFYLICSSSLTSQVVLFLQLVLYDVNSPFYQGAKASSIMDKPLLPVSHLCLGSFLGVKETQLLPA